MQDRPRRAQKPGSEHVRAPAATSEARCGEVGRVRPSSRLWFWALTILALMAGPGSAAAAESGRPSTAGALAVRMSENLAWPERFSAIVRLEPYQAPGSGGTAAGAGQGGPERAAASLKLVGFPPETFRWDPISEAVIPGTAWGGYVQLETSEPGPKFAYSYEAFPFLKVLQVYFGIFRPLPEGSRLVLNRSVRVLGRPAVEATLVDAEPRQQMKLVVDSETGLILEAAVQSPDPAGRAQQVVKAVRFDTGVAVTTVEYEAPVLGRLGRLTLARRPPGSWFVLEAVVGDEAEAYRLRFDQVQLGEAAGDLKRPDTSALRQLAQLDEEARALHREKRYAEAAQRLRALVRIDPYNVNAHNLLGNVAMEMGDWVTASSEFDQVIHLAPDSPLGYNNLAYLYTELGLSLSVALELAQKAMDLSGGEPHGSVLDTYGWALFHNGRAEEAVPVLERAVALSGDDPESQAEVLYHLGVVQLSLHRVEEARRLFTQALQLNPELTKARQALGTLEQEKSKAAAP